MTRRRGVRQRLLYLGLVVVAAAGILAAVVYAAVHPNSNPITVTDSPSSGAVGQANPYPSVITVSGEALPISNVVVRLNGLQQGFSDDFDVLLESPDGTAVIVMSDAGDGNPVTGLDLYFSDAALSTLPNEAPPSSGTWKPSNFTKSAAPACTVEPDPDVFPSPAPGSPAALLAAFIGGEPNGDWKLYVVDDCGGDAGSIANGWSLTLNTAPTAVRVRSFTGRAMARAAELRWRTATETAIAGFHVVRTTRGAGPKRVNPRLIPAKRAATTAGAHYRLVDRTVRRGVSYTYRLQVLGLDGKRRSAGVVALRAG